MIARRPSGCRLATTALALVILSSPGSGLSAQVEEPVRPGARLRVTTAEPLRAVRIGALESLTDTGFTLLSGSTVHTIPFGTVTRMEVSRGKRLNIPVGVVGLVLGGAAGGAVGCLANRDSYGVFCGGQDDTKVIAGAVLGAAVGGVLGAVVFRREAWSPLDIAALRR